jgi:hypothetical protein
MQQQPVGQARSISAASPSRYSGRARIAAWARKASASTKCCAARRSARTRASTSPRRCSITGSRMASTFSTPRRQICAVASTMVPAPRSTATLFHGSPTQIAVDLPCLQRIGAKGGGTVRSRHRDQGGCRIRQPVAQHVIMAGIAMHHAKTQRIARSQTLLRHRAQAAPTAAGSPSPPPD